MSSIQDCSAANQEGNPERQTNRQRSAAFLQLQQSTIVPGFECHGRAQQGIWTRRETADVNLDLYMGNEDSGFLTGGRGGNGEGGYQRFCLPKER